MSTDCKEGGNTTEGQIEEFKKTDGPCILRGAESFSDPACAQHHGTQTFMFPCDGGNSTSGACKTENLGKKSSFYCVSQQKIEPLSGRPETQVGGGDASLRREARRARRNFLFIFFLLTETDDQLIEHNVVGKRCPPH